MIKVLTKSDNPEMKAKGEAMLNGVVIWSLCFCLVCFAFALYLNANTLFGAFKIWERV